MPSIVSIFASNMNSQEDFNLLVKVSRIVFPYLIFIVISSVFVGTLNANHKFALAAGLPIFLNCSLMFCIIIHVLFYKYLHSVVYFHTHCQAGELARAREAPGIPRVHPPDISTH